MKDLGHVVVLAGGLSHEREVSLRSGRRVAETLRSTGVSVEQRDADNSFLDSLSVEKPSVVFPLLHGAQGEDGAIQEVLTLLDIPYVGSTPAACRRTFDKAVAKGVLAQAGLTTPEAVTLPHTTFRDLGADTLLNSIVNRLDLPLVVKPLRGGSALGTSLVHKADQLPAAMVECFSYGDSALVEKKISGTEVAVSIINTGDGPQPLPPVEILPESGTYDFHARYTAGATEFFVPARLSSATLRAIEEAAIAAHEALGLADISRVDFIIEDDGFPWLLDVNVAPGMTETSLLPQAAEAAGLELGVLAYDLLSTAIHRKEMSLLP